MTYRSSRACIWFCVYMTLVITTLTANEDRFPREIQKMQQYYSNEAFKGKIIFSRNKIPEDLLHRKKFCHLGCPGPVAHLKTFNCTPVFYADHCCPTRYECKINLDPFQCFFNGHWYQVGDKIKPEDAIPCEENCICRIGRMGYADFECPTEEELCPPYVPKRDGCYQRKSLEQCCPTEEVCPEEPRNLIPVCVVDGAVVLDGQYVFLRYMPELICICQANNTDVKEGKIVCVASKRWFWSDIHASIGAILLCIPVYLPHKGKIPGVTRLSWRCPKSEDRVYCSMKRQSKKESEDLHRPDTKIPYFFLDACDTDPADWQEWYLSMIVETGFPFSYRCQFLLWFKHQCIFADLRMHIGDKLNTQINGDGSCIACTCEVPPVPTCVYKACSEVNLEDEKDFVKKPKRPKQKIPTEADVSIYYVFKRYGNDVWYRSLKIPSAD